MTDEGGSAIFMDNPGGSRGSTTLSTAEHAALPEGKISEILGFIGLLESKGGREDIYKLAAELNMELGEVLTVIRGAEALKLVHTPGGDVVLEELGRKLNDLDISDKKQILLRQIEKIPVIQKVCAYLKNQEGHEATRDEVLEKLGELIPNENPEVSFSAVVEWGRYVELFGYNDDTETFYLDDEASSTH